MESKRQHQYSRQIQKDLSDIFQRDTKHFFLDNLVSIIGVETASDLSIAKIKVHDLVLTENDVLQSFDEDKNQFGKGGPEIISFESSETQISPDDTITLSWEIDGAEKISIDNGVGDVSNEEEVDVSIEETTTFTITATDDAGLSQTDSILIIVSDGSALIDIDLTGLDPGPLQTIINQGSLAGDFEAEFDTPNIETIDGVNAVTLDGNNDWCIGGFCMVNGFNGLRHYTVISSYY